MQRVLLRSALLVASVALVVLVAEGVARLTWRESKPPPPPPPPFALLRLPVLRTIAEIDRPGVRGVFKEHLFRTNSHGVRGPEYATRPPRGVFRIAIVGDSVTMGSGVDEEDAYPALLEALLNAGATAGERRYEVLNFGLAANNIEGSVLRLRYLAGVYRPDLVVYGFTVNDIEGRHYKPLRWG